MFALVHVHKASGKVGWKAWLLEEVESNLLLGFLLAKLESIFLRKIRKYWKPIVDHSRRCIFAVTVHAICSFNTISLRREVVTNPVKTLY